MGKVNLNFGFSTTNVGATVAALQEVGWVSKLPPETLRIGTEPATVDASWAKRSIESGYATAVWEGEITKMVIRDSAIVYGNREDAELSIDRALKILASVPFTVASFGTVHHWPGYAAPSFGDHHAPHGWGCAFKGAAGHARLVLTRWLATGPWRVLKSGDVTLVQFHDLDASPAAALEQAKPGHITMGINKKGGFLQTNYQFRTELAGLHSSKQRALIFVLKGKSPEPLELRDAAAARQLQPFGASKPIDDVVYVFIDKAEADKQLPLIWRYGHQVRLIGDDGAERRIDEDFQPTLDKPAWVDKLGRDDAKEFLK